MNISHRKEGLASQYISLPRIDIDATKIFSIFAEGAEKTLESLKCMSELFQGTSLQSLEIQLLAFFISIIITLLLLQNAHHTK